MGNQVYALQAILMFVIYILHIILMKFSSKYEVVIKTALANAMEKSELTKIAKKDISMYH